MDVQPRNSLVTSILIFTLLFCSSSLASVQCLDVDKNPVDWWIILKLPMRTTPATGGVSYIYMDQKGSQYFSDSTTAITRPSQPVAYTLNQIYKNISSNSVSWVMYNDSPPNDTWYDFYKGHTKGVVAFDDVSGFWLVQSVPKFPPEAAAAAYSYPDSGKLNGQNMLCVSLPVASFNQIGTQFTYSNPHFYSSFLHNENLAPILAAIVNKKIIPVLSPAFHSEKLVSLAGQAFYSFVQTNTYPSPENPDFYSCIANGNAAHCNGGFAHTLNENLFVQSWLNSEVPQPQICGQPYRINDATDYSASAGKYTWTTLIDHSKWAISAAKNSATVCFGDLNRVISQQFRGGGTVCFEDQAVHNLLLEQTTRTDPCP
jgi:deoxyribonuclease II